MPISDCKVPEYQKAQWKGVPFNVESSSDEFGRRGDLYEYPLSEDTAYKDLGRKARRFRVEGYLIGGEQVALTRRMARAAESKEPGTLIHPMYGSQLVSCVTLTATADYKRDQRRTKLSFEFVEANQSVSPFKTGGDNVGDAGSKAVEEAKGSAGGLPVDDNVTNAGANISGNLSEQVTPPRDEASHDANDLLNAGQFGGFTPASRNLNTAPQAAPQAAADTSAPVVFYSTFRSIADPIDNGTATVVRIHKDSLRRLREFNRYVVTQSDGTPGVETLIITTRLCLIRDFAVKASRTKYATIRDALADLDFIMSVYDDEERAAMTRCQDALVTAIRQARAVAAQAILSRNIRLPGVVRRSVDGVWPSLVAAHKVYFDGKRFQDVENYNPQMSPFFIGRDIVGPAPE